MGLPGVMPTAHAQVASHPNLFVSAENSQWNNYFAGPQVVQVIVSDPNINRLDQAYGEPVVNVNGKRLRMAQATDGNWYGYFADRNQMISAGKTQRVNGTGLNPGLFCGPNSPGFNPKAGVDYTQTKGFTIARDINDQAGTAGFLNASSLSVGSIGNVCNSGAFTAFTPNGGFYNGKIALNRVTNTTTNYVRGVSHVSTIENIIRQNTTLNTNSLGFFANGLYTGIWPVIQLYDFSAIPTPVTVDYSAAGGDQIVNLTFDRIPSNLITVTPDRTAYPENSQVFLTMNDPQLNVDPTEEDSWTFGANTTNPTLYYMAFDRNGIERSDGTSGPGASGTQPAMQNLIGNLTTFMFNHNGKFTFVPQAQNVRIVDFQSNGKANLNASSTTRGNPSHQHIQNLTTNSLPITFIEQGGVNTGVFGNWDGGKKSNIITLTPAEEVNLGSIRGQSATFLYNEIGGSVVGGFAFGSITMSATNGTWQGGTRIPVTLTDADSNKNSKITEHLNDWDPNYDRIAAMKIGTPFSLDAGGPTNTPTPPETALIFSNSTSTGTIGQTAGTAVTFTPAAGLVGKGNTTLFFSQNLGHFASSTNVATDEFFSGRPVFQFTNATNAASAVQIENGGGIFFDLKTTAKTLYNTINDPTNGTAKFRGFNFLNYDMRDFSTLAGANNTASTVSAYLVFNNSLSSGSSFTSSTTGLLTVRSASAISLANSTNLLDFINLNETFVNPTYVAGAPTTNNPAEGAYSLTPATAVDLVHQIKLHVSINSPIGLLFTFGVPQQTGHIGALKLGNNNKIAVAVDFFSVGITGDGSQNSQRINNGIYRFELEETGDNTGVFTGSNQFLSSTSLTSLIQTPIHN